MNSSSSSPFCLPQILPHPTPPERVPISSSTTHLHRRMPQWPDSPAEAMHLQQFCMEVLPLIPCKSNKNYHDLFEAAIPWLNNAFQVAGLSRRVAGRRDIELLHDYFKRLFQIVSSKRRKTGSVTRAFEKLEAGYADLPEHLKPLGVSDGVREMGERLARKVRVHKSLDSVVLPDAFEGS